MTFFIKVKCFLSDSSAVFCSESLDETSNLTADNGRPVEVKEEEEEEEDETKEKLAAKKKRGRSKSQSKSDDTPKEELKSEGDMELISIFVTLLE